MITGVTPGIRVPASGPAPIRPLVSRSRNGLQARAGIAEPASQTRRGLHDAGFERALQRLVEALPGRDHADAAHDADGGEDRRRERAGPDVCFVVAHGKAFATD